MLVQASVGPLNKVAKREGDWSGRGVSVVYWYLGMHINLASNGSTALARDSDSSRSGAKWVSPRPANARNTPDTPTPSRGPGPDLLGPFFSHSTSSPRPRP